MSSPLSSLKKSSGRKMLPGLQNSAGSRSPAVPCRSPAFVADELLLHDVTSRMARTPGGLVSPLPGKSPSTSRATPVQAPTDMDLMQTMVTKIASLEKQVVHQSREIIDKDKRIRVLEEKAAILQRATAEKLSSPDYVKELEKQCMLLQQQVSEMEEFLADYGMIWVGSVSDPETNVYSKDEDDSPTVWQPAASLAQDYIVVDYDAILKNVNELNILAGEGQAKIQHTVDGARLKIPDPVQLILYANGIIMFDGPFRPFSDPSTQQVIRDLTDGYFPSELRNRYPDGIPFKVHDKRKINFQPRGIQAFIGEGKTVGGNEQHKQQSRLVPQGDGNGSRLLAQSHHAVDSEIPGQQRLTAEQFLMHLPPSIIKSGRIIDIRSSLAETLQGTASKAGSVTVVETEALKELQSRQSTQDNEHRPPSGKNMTTLRVRSATGEQTFILKMRATDTIGDVRRYLSKHGLSGTAAAYSLVTAFPSKACDDDSQTLLDAGLVPASNLHIRPRK